MSPLDYVHHLRLEEAKQMLEATDLPVEAIAEEVGYRDTSFFGRPLQTQGRADAGPVPAPLRRVRSPAATSRQTARRQPCEAVTRV